MNAELFQAAATITAAIVSKTSGKQNPDAACKEFMAVYRKLRDAAVTLSEEEAKLPKKFQFFTVG